MGIVENMSGFQCPCCQVDNCECVAYDLYVMFLTGVLATLLQRWSAEISWGIWSTCTGNCTTGPSETCSVSSLAYQAFISLSLKSSSQIWVSLVTHWISDNLVSKIDWVSITCTSPTTKTYNDQRTPLKAWIWNIAATSLLTSPLLSFLPSFSSFLPSFLLNRCWYSVVKRDRTYLPPMQTLQLQNPLWQ